MNTEIMRKLEEIKIPKSLIDSILSTKSVTLSLDNEDIIRVGISSEIAYEFYCDDYLSNPNLREVGLMDIVYSTVDSGCFESAYRYAETHESRVRKGVYDAHSVAHQTALVCYILVKVNEYKYSKLKTINDVKDPVPFMVYKKIINDSPEEIEVYVKREDEIYAGTLESISTHEGMFGVSVFAHINIVSRGTNKYCLGELRVKINPKELIRTMDDMELNLMTEEIKLELTNRGKKYIEITQNPKYCEYHGEAFTPGMMGDIRHRVDSRVMIDIESMRLLNSGISNRWYIGSIFRDSQTIGNTVPEDMLWMCSPVVYGFSFGNKIWCKMNINNISEIKFSENAFEELIIPQENKDVFVASLTHDMPSLDSISDKGAGKIFLLYGAPGVGK